MTAETHENQHLPKKMIRLLEDRGIFSDSEHKCLVLDIMGRIYRDREITRLFVSGIRRRDRSNLVQTAELSKTERYAYNRFNNSLSENKRLRVENVTDEILTYVIQRDNDHPDFNRLAKTPFRLKLTEMIYKMRKKSYNKAAKKTLIIGKNISI